MRAPLDGSVGRAGAVALVVAALYGAWIGLYLGRHSVYDLAAVGRELLAQGAGSSPAIDALAPHAVDGGYDGQFSLYIALDPADAHAYIDAPVYRYSRALYPLAARVLALGQQGAIPWAMLVLNLTAVVVATFLLALFLVRKDVSPWLALLYGASPALFIAVDRDITEPLAYGLVIGALFALDSRRWLPAGALFGLAGLARETTLLFPIAVLVMAALGLALKRRRPYELMAFAALSLAPFVWLRIALEAWLGPDPPPGAPSLVAIPFSGLLGQPSVAQYEQFLAVVLPALFALVALVVALPRERRALVLPLAVNVAVLVVLLPESSYASFQHSGRITLGVVIAFLLCLPDVPARHRAAVVAGPAVLWLTPWYAFFPIALSA